MNLIYDPTRKIIYDLDSLPYVSLADMKVWLMPNPAAEPDDPWMEFFAAWEQHISNDLNEQPASIVRSQKRRSAK
jgi:hypothetical protein